MPLPRQPAVTAGNTVIRLIKRQPHGKEDGNAIGHRHLSSRVRLPCRAGDGRVQRGLAGKDSCSRPQRPSAKGWQSRQIRTQSRLPTHRLFAKRLAPFPELSKSPLKLPKVACHRLWENG